MKLADVGTVVLTFTHPQQVYPVFKGNTLMTQVPTLDARLGCSLVIPPLDFSAWLPGTPSECLLRVCARGTRFGYLSVPSRVPCPIFSSPGTRFGSELPAPGTE